MKLATLLFFLSLCKRLSGTPPILVVGFAMRNSEGLLNIQSLSLFPLHKGALINLPSVYQEMMRRPERVLNLSGLRGHFLTKEAQLRQEYHRLK